MCFVHRDMRIVNIAISFEWPLVVQTVLRLKLLFNNNNNKMYKLYHYNLSELLTKKFIKTYFFIINLEKNNSQNLSTDLDL